MGLFDIFKKKDGAFYLPRARKALEREAWVDARDEARLGLERLGSDSSLEGELREVLGAANRGIVRMNLHEAEICQRLGDYGRAMDHLEVARFHADGDVLVEQVNAAEVKLKEHKSLEGKRKEEQTAAEAARMALEDEFNVYIASLTSPVADLYATLGDDFARGYIHLNQGEPEKALECFVKRQPQSQDESALLAFEQARALLMMGKADKALVLLDLAASVRGAEPIFTTDHPSIPYYRFEALAMLRRLDDAASALREGLEARPKNLELRRSLAGLLIAQGKLDEAEEHVEEGLACAMNDPQNHLLKAKIVSERGDTQGAIEILENGIACCSGGRGALPHPMLSRSLISLYIDTKQQPARVDTLLVKLFEALNGQEEWVDHFLRARFLKWQGDEARARVSWKKAMDELPNDPRDPRRKEVVELFRD